MGTMEAEVRAQLEPLILGRRKAAWSCCCGTLGAPESEAVAVTCRFPDEPFASYSWCVEMRATDGTGKTYGTSTLDFDGVANVFESLRHLIDEARERDAPTEDEGR